MNPTIQQTHLQSSKLHPQDPVYKEWVDRYTFQELKMDLGENGDITTSLLFPPDAKGSAHIVAKQPGILAGIQEIEYFLHTFPVQKEFLKKDGEMLAANDVIVKISGKVHDLMKLERVILNVIGRMSGVATLTHRFTSRAKEVNPDILLTPTRKTLWGWLDKRACVLGGGGTHRLSLADAILIKHNHLRAFGGNFQAMLEKAVSEKPNAKFLEVEINDPKDAEIAVKIFIEAKKKGFTIPCFIMYDNVPVEEVFRSLHHIRATYSLGGIFFEASGGVNETNLTAFVKAGVDIISLGIMTHGAPMLDVSLRII